MTHSTHIIRHQQVPTIWHTSTNPLHKKSHFSLIFNGNRDVDKAEVKFLLIFIIHFNGYEIMMMTWQDYKHREWIHVVVSSFFLGRSWLSSFFVVAGCKWENSALFFFICCWMIVKLSLLLLWERMAFFSEVFIDIFKLQWGFSA